MQDNNNGSTRLVGYLILAALVALALSIWLAFAAHAEANNIDVVLHFQDTQGAPAVNAPFTAQRVYDNGQHMTAGTALADSEGNVVWLDTPEGIWTITPGCGVPLQFTIDPGAEVSGQMIFILTWEPCGVTLYVNAYHDLNGNGTRDDGDSPVADSLFTIVTPDGLATTGITNANGEATIEDAAAGEWLFKFDACSWVRVTVGADSMVVYVRAWAACVWLPEVRR